MTYDLSRSVSLYSYIHFSAVCAYQEIQWLTEYYMDDIEFLQANSKQRANKLGNGFAYMNSGILKTQTASHSKNLCIPHLSVRNTILFKIFIIACPIHFIILLSHDCAKQEVDS